MQICNLIIVRSKVAKRSKYAGARFCYGFIALFFGIVSLGNLIIILFIQIHHKDDKALDVIVVAFMGLVSFFAFKRYKYWCKKATDYVEPKIDIETL